MAIFIQLLLAVVITTLTLLIGIIAVQLFQILHEFRQTVRKINRILDNTQVMTETVARPISAVNNFFGQVRDMVNRTEEQIIEQTPDRVLPGGKPRFFRRLFHRAGLPLRSPD
jgi:hypothetical protein